jgi:hypothetical protein
MCLPAVGCPERLIGSEVETSMSSIDPQANEVGTKRLGFRPAAVAVDQRAVWVARPPDPGRGRAPRRLPPRSQPASRFGGQPDAHRRRRPPADPTAGTSLMVFSDGYSLQLAR